jgi:hypothetical protein
MTIATILFSLLTVDCCASLNSESIDPSYITLNTTSSLQHNMKFRGTLQSPSGRCSFACSFRYARQHRMSISVPPESSCRAYLPQAPFVLLRRRRNKILVCGDDSSLLLLSLLVSAFKHRATAVLISVETLFVPKQVLDSRLAQGGHGGVKSCRDIV